MLPIGFVAIDFFTNGKSFNLANLIGNGELLLVTSGIAAAGLGELISESPKKSIGVMFTGASSLILIGVCSYSFSSVVSSQNPDISNITSGSIWVFIISVFTTVVCFIQSETPSWKI
ncbi:hypothetical protein GCM10011338_40480 [Alteromonas lipolytica]|nr:hypothetical protein GCM10011338_40480 [Alteromonas lipolytica]